MPAPRTTTAQREYTARLSKVKAIMARLDRALDLHADRASSQPDNWRFTDEVGAVEAGLSQLLASITA